MSPLKYLLDGKRLFSLGGDIPLLIFWQSGPKGCPMALKVVTTALTLYCTGHDCQHSNFPPFPATEAAALPEKV